MVCNFMVGGMIGKLSITVVAIPLFLVTSANALPEKHYQAEWCQEQGGQTEVILADGTRVDCLTSTHAVEFDFGKKWAESIGQSLFYSLQTGKKAGIILIVGPEDRKYWLRLNSTIRHFNLPIDTWEVGK